VLPLNNPLSKSEVREVIHDVSFFGGTTFTNEALEKALQQLQNSTTKKQAKQVVIIFTDGFSYEDPSPAAKALHDKNIPVLAVAINDKFPVNRVELEILTWYQSAHIFMDKNFDDIKTALGQLTTC